MGSLPTWKCRYNKGQIAAVPKAKNTYKQQMSFRTGPRRRGNPLALQTVAGIATPVCRSVRNDIFSFRRFVPIASFLCVLQQLPGLLANGAALLVLSGFLHRHILVHFPAETGIAIHILGAQVFLYGDLLIIISFPSICLLFLKCLGHGDRKGAALARRSSACTRISSSESSMGLTI